MPVLDPGRRRTRNCQFWAHAMDDRPWGGPSPPAVAYVSADGPGTAEIAGQLTGFSGILQVDGYAACKALARSHGGAIQLAFCLAHARRKFIEVYKTIQPPFAREVIERLQAVYTIEAEIRGSSAEQRLAARRTRSAPFTVALKAPLTKMVGQLFSPSKLAEAINYALNHWDGLTLFLRRVASRLTPTQSSVPCARLPWEDATHCLAAAKAVLRSGRSWPRSSTQQSSMISTRRPIWPTCWNASSPSNPRAISCTSCSPGTGKAARMSPRRHKATSSMAAAAMPLAELERWLQGRADRHPIATSLPMLDSYVAV